MMVPAVTINPSLILRGIWFAQNLWLLPLLRTFLLGADVAFLTFCDLSELQKRHTTCGPCRNAATHCRSPVLRTETIKSLRRDKPTI